jgi:UDP-glucose 4-epimerase
MATYGVTGGNGFIGHHITSELQNRGHDVLVFDHVNRPTTAELMLGDIRDRTAVFELAAHVDGIIHLAAVLGTQETIGNALPAVETNMIGGINILEAANQYGLPLVYAGVGNYWMNNTYSTTKTAVERLLYQFRDEQNARFATVRPVNAYGPGQRVAPPFGPGKVKKIMPAFSCRALTGQPLEVYGSGQQISDMIYVEDVANVFATTLEHLENSPVPKYSIEAGPTESLTVRQVAEQVINKASILTGFTSEIIDLPMRPGEKRVNDVPQQLLDQISAALGNDSNSRIIRRNLRELSTRVTADITTLEQIGMAASSFTPFERGCALTVEWFFNNKGVTWNDNRN